MLGYDGNKVCTNWMDVVHLFESIQGSRAIHWWNEKLCVMLTLRISHCKRRWPCRWLEIRNIVCLFCFTSLENPDNRGQHLSDSLCLVVVGLWTHVSSVGHIRKLLCTVVFSACPAFRTPYIQKKKEKEKKQITNWNEVWVVMIVMTFRCGTSASSIHIT